MAKTEEKTLDEKVTSVTIARYDKILRIGQGTFGIVYLAKDRLSEEYVALKRFLEQEDFLEDLQAYCKWEVSLLHKVRHPNIIEAKQLVTSSSKAVFIAYEYCEHDLQSLIAARKYPYSEAQVKCIIRQILLGMGHLHKCGYMHRDLKCCNILMNKFGHVKLCDFGSAKKIRVLSSETGKPEAHTPGMTTPNYSAPEMLLSSEDYTEKCDIWSVGCILGELWRHKILLFTGSSVLEYLSGWMELLGSPWLKWKEFYNLPAANLLKVNTEPQDNIERDFCDISRSGQDLMRALLHYDPQQRPSADEALEFPYFTEHPLPVDPAELPQMPSTLESSGKKRKQGVMDIAHYFGDKPSWKETPEKNATRLGIKKTRGL